MLVHLCQSLILQRIQSHYNVLLPKSEDHILSDLNVRRLSNELPEVFSYIKHIPKLKQRVHLELNNGDPFLMEFDLINCI